MCNRYTCKIPKIRELAPNTILRQNLFSFWPEGRTYILRRPGERNCPDCIQELKQSKNEERKKNPENEPKLDLSYKLYY